MLKNCKQIEFNDHLTPELLCKKPETDGYLAIFMFKKIEDGDTAVELVKLHKVRPNPRIILQQSSQQDYQSPAITGSKK